MSIISPNGTRVHRPRAGLTSDEDDDVQGSWADRWWFAICVAALILGSDYKIRTRESGLQSSSIDSVIVVELVVYLIVGLFAISRHGRPPRFVSVPVHVYLACFFVGLTVLSIASAEFPQYTLVRSGQMTILLVLILVFVASPESSRDHLHRFAHLFVALVVISVGYGIAVPSKPFSREQEGRFTWLAIHPTVSGLLAGLASLIALAYIVWGNRARPGPHWPRPLYALIFLVVGGSMLASHTRGPVLGALIGGLVLALTLVHGPARARLLAGLATTGAIAALAAGDLVTSYFARGEQASELASLNSRTDLWAVAVAAIERQPLFGYGVGASRGIFQAETGLGGAHNAAINVVVDLGIVGALCWLALIAALTVGSIRLPTTINDAMTLDRSMLIAVITFLMVVGIFFEGPGAVANVASTWLFVCVGWLSIAQRDTDLSRSDTQPPS